MIVLLDNSSDPIEHEASISDEIAEVRRLIDETKRTMMTPTDEILAGNEDADRLLETTPDFSEVHGRLEGIHGRPPLPPNVSALFATLGLASLVGVLFVVTLLLLQQSEALVVILGAEGTILAGLVGLAMHLAGTYRNAVAEYDKRSAMWTKSSCALALVRELSQSIELSAEAKVQFLSAASAMLGETT